MAVERIALRQTSTARFIAQLRTKGGRRSRDVGMWALQIALR